MRLVSVRIQHAEEKMQASLEGDTASRHSSAKENACQEEIAEVVGTIPTVPRKLKSLVDLRIAFNLKIFHLDVLIAFVHSSYL